MPKATLNKPPRCLVWRLLALVGVTALAGCTSLPAAPPKLPPIASDAVANLGPAGLPAPRSGAMGRVGGAGKEMLIYLPNAGDSLDGIAQRFLGSPRQSWVIAQANSGSPKVQPGRPLRIPLQAPAPWGVSRDGVQTVTVLCYHRFTAGKGPTRSKMILPAEQFEAQLQWLQREGYRSLRMGEFQAFLDGREALPPRSVLITIDDGFESFHAHALPLLKKYQMPATLFVYTDVVGTRDGMSWAQLREIAQSGLVDIQAHSRTHRNLAERLPGESDAAYRRNLQQELRHPRAVLERQLGMLGVKVQHFAYPYGAGNAQVLEALAEEGYSLGFTVREGPNPFYEQPHWLRRTMIFGDHSMDDFVARVQPQRPLTRP
jgi:peptidoglycan/xylan/chitin deacetylase (PgdA/CDA1 family)